MIAAAIPSVAATRTGDSTLGRICRVMIRRDGVPIDRAASTNSRSFSASTSPRTTRAACIQLVSPIAMTISRKVPSRGPRMPATVSRNRKIITSSKGSSGSARKRSVSRIRSPSIRRKKPAITPTVVPMKIATSIATVPTASEMRPPNIIRASMSRPS